MEAASNRKEPRPWVVDLLSTLFVAFCIGIASAIVMGACVMLMAGEARGEMSEGVPAEEMRAQVNELVLTHQLATRYTGLVAMDRSADLTPAQSGETDLDTAALTTPGYEAIFGTQQADAAPVDPLPQGATDSRFKLLAGALMILFATALFWHVRDVRRVRLRIARGRRP